MLDSAEDLRVTAGASGEAPVGGQGKRLFDLVAAISGLMILLPLLLGIALLVWLSCGRPILIRHSRIGYRGKTFPCLKFRSMIANADEVLDRHLESNPAARAEWMATRKLKDDPRVTPVGRVLRKLSIDELPQLINIVQGHMSFVGPRPIVAAEMERYGSAIDEYLAARPGLTGLWQVSGRSDTTYETRIVLDKEYVQTWSMSRDFAIIVRTVPVVIKSEGTY